MFKSPPSTPLPSTAEPYAMSAEELTLFNQRSFPTLQQVLAVLRNQARCVHGHLLLGRCFCDPGYAGDTCEQKTLLLGPCNSKSDACFASNVGVCFIDYPRWRRAQKAEGAAWKNNMETSDRGMDHLGGFLNYSKVPHNLGNFVEVGCGPWTQSNLMFNTRPDIVVKSITLWEPGVNFYIQNTPTCAYKNGFLGNRSAILVQAGAEDLVFPEMFDSLMMINVLEHTRNIFVILHNIYTTLKPGGLLIFNDRWWNDFNHRKTIDLDMLYHPIRCYREVFDHFLSFFEPILENVNPYEVVQYFPDDRRNSGGIYYIGRKK